MKSVFFDQILVEEEGYYILYGYTEDYFVKFINEPIDYNGMEADLYIITNVTEKIKNERKLEALSMVDELTKLGNRRMMVKENNDLVFPYVKAGNEAFLAMLDLDDFKKVNDEFGHVVGDKVLIQTINIMNMNIRKTDSLYRMGGDEFALIFRGISEVKMKEKVNEIVSQIKN